MQEANINAAVRKGDIFGFMIEHFVRMQNYREAYELVQVNKVSSNVNVVMYWSLKMTLALSRCDFKALTMLIFVDSKTNFEMVDLS